MLNINTSAEQGKLIATLEGKLDTRTAPELEKKIKENIDGVTDLTIDLEKLEYISSAGLRVLLGAQKIMNGQGQMRVTNANELIMEIFEDTGFVNVLTIE